MNASDLDDTQQCIGEFYDTMSDVLGSIQRHEDRLASHHALGAAAKDRRHYDKMRVGIHCVLCISCDMTGPVLRRNEMPLYVVSFCASLD